MNDSTRRAARFFIALVTCVAFSSVAFASKDEDRDTAGLQKLGIGNSFGRWPGGIVQWVYNPTGRSAYFSDDNEFVNLLMEAMTEIENASGVDFQYLGIDSAAVIGNFADSIVTIGWEDLNGAAGVAGPASSCNGASILAIGYCQYVDGSVRFNNDINDVNWDKGDAETSENGLIQVAMHEILHLLGIGHSDIPESIMYANPYTNLSHLHDDDLDALRSMYGPSSTPADPPQYTPPAAGAGDPLITDFFIATQNSIGTPISTVGDGEPAAFVGLSWKKLNGDAPDITFVAEDPAGFYYTMRVDTRDCTAGPGFICTFWASAFSTATLQTYPGIWRIHAMVNGNLIETNDLDVQFTPPVLNEAPDASIMFDVTSGPGPLTVNATLTVTGDAEGDDISATWHVPTYGQLASTVSTGGGVDQRQFTFNQDGDYEIYVVVNDDWVRYGTPGSGAEAGPGFRRLFRQVIQVGNVPPADPLSDVVGLSDLSGNGLGEVGVLLQDAVSGDWVVTIRDGSTDALVSSVNFGSEPAVSLEVIGDLNSNGAEELALLSNRGSGQVAVVIRDSLSGAVLNTIFYGSSYVGRDLAVMPDTDGNGAPELVVLGVEAGGGIRAQARDALTDAETSTTFYGSNAEALDVQVIPDVSGNGEPEVLVHARVTASGQGRAQLRDSSTGAFIRNIFFGNTYRPLQLVVIEDLSGDGIPDLAQLSRRDDTGAVRIQTKNAANGALIANAFTGNTDTPVSIIGIADANGNTVEDVAMLVEEPGGTGKIIVRDGGSGDFIRNIFVAGAGQPKGMAKVSDLNASGQPELAVLGNAAGQHKVQIKDSITGAQINNIDFP